MHKPELFAIPHRDPVTGGELYISELTGVDSGVTLRGKFSIPKYAQLDADSAKFLETFLRCRGMLSAVEKELGLSYPTVRARLDSLLEALSLAPIKETKHTKEQTSEARRKILEQLEKGEISADEAKARIREGA